MAHCDPNTRLSQYKQRKISSQEERRKQLLEEQKRLRKEAFDEGRHLIDVSDSFHKHGYEKNKFYSRKHMLSEWFLEIPSDLEEDWVMVPCPVGKRVLVLSGRGITIGFAKDGTVLGRFRSCLPGGHCDSGEPTRGFTLLDCIWSKNNRSYYILDVLAWNKQSFLDCDTEFRFYWLKSKISEIENINEISDNNYFSFYLLPNFPCDRATLETVLSFHPLVPNIAIDGLLFYHSKAHYVAGTTPLVGWLKPFMIPDLFNFNVCEELLYGKPEDYIDYKKYIHDYEMNEQKKRNSRKYKQFKRNFSKKMEVDVIETDEGLDNDGNSEDCSELLMEHCDEQDISASELEFEETLLTRELT